MKKHVAIVTGVSRLNGIGKAICVELAKNGCDIFFKYWTQYDKEMPWATADNEPDLIENPKTPHGSLHSRQASKRHG